MPPNHSKIIIQHISTSYKQDGKRSHLARNVKIRLILHRALERPAVVLYKVKVHRSLSPGILGILDQCRMHIDEPALSASAFLQPREPKFLINFVAQADLLESFGELCTVIFALRCWAFSWWVSVLCAASSTSSSATTPTKTGVSPITSASSASST